MRVVVTGAAGFFGRGITAELLAAGHDVIGFDRNAADASCEQGDITNPADCARVLTGRDVDAVVHAAALAHVSERRVDESVCRRVNVEGTRNVIDAAVCAGVRRFVFISSITVYGDYDLDAPVGEDAPWRPTGLYGESKRQAEAAVQSRSAETSVWVLRMATMYSATWLFNLRKRVAPPIIGGMLRFKLNPVAPRYSFCSLRNGSAAVRWAVEERLPPGTYNVADSHAYSQADILLAVERVEGHKPSLLIPRLLPEMAHRIAARTTSGQRRHRARSRYWKYCASNVYSTERLRSFGFVAPAHLLELESER